MSHNNLAEKAAEASKRKHRVNLKTIGEFISNHADVLVVAVAAVIGVIAAILMFANNASYNPSLFLWGKIAVIVEFLLVGWWGGLIIVAVKEEVPAYAWLCAVLAILFLVFAIIGCSNATFSKDDWKKTESGLYYKMEEGGIHIIGVDRGVTAVTIEEEYDFFPVRSIELSVGKKYKLAELTVKLGDFVTTDFKFKKADSLRSVSFEGGSLSLWAKTFKKCTALQSVRFEGCQVKLFYNAFRDSYLLALHISDSTVQMGTSAFIGTGVADLFAEKSTIGSTLSLEDDVTARVNPFRDCMLNRASLKDTTLVNIRTAIGTLVLDGACHIAINNTYLDPNDKPLTEDVIIRSLVLAEGFNAETSTLSYRNDSYSGKKYIDSAYVPFSGHVFVPAGMKTLPDALFGDKAIATTPKVTVHYGGDEAAFAGVTVGANNNALFEAAEIRYNETSEYWAK